MNKTEVLKKLNARRKMFEDYLRQTKIPAGKQDISKKAVK